MSKRTLFLIFTLFIIAFVLLMLALFNPNTTPTPTSPKVAKESPKPQEAQTSLVFGEPYTASSSSSFKYSIPVNISTGENKVTAVQLELQFDPQIIDNITIDNGSFFQNPTTLLNQVNQTDGRISYALGLGLEKHGISGKGTVATINFETIAKTPQETVMLFLPKTSVTADEIIGSALKNTLNTKFSVKARISTSSATITPSQ